jgi:hypothetical protein
MQVEQHKLFQFIISSLIIGGIISLILIPDLTIRFLISVVLIYIYGIFLILLNGIIYYLYKENEKHKFLLNNSNHSEVERNIPQIQEETFNREYPQIIQENTTYTQNPYLSPDYLLYLDNEEKRLD